MESGMGNMQEDRVGDLVTIIQRVQEIRSRVVTISERAQLAADKLYGTKSVSNCDGEKEVPSSNAGLDILGHNLDILAVEIEDLFYHVRRLDCL